MSLLQRDLDEVAIRSGKPRSGVALHGRADEVPFPDTSIQGPSTLRTVIIDVDDIVRYNAAREVAEKRAPEDEHREATFQHTVAPPPDGPPLSPNGAGSFMGATGDITAMLSGCTVPPRPVHDPVVQHMYNLFEQGAASEVKTRLPLIPPSRRADVYSFRPTEAAKTGFELIISNPALLKTAVSNEALREELNAQLSAHPRYSSIALEVKHTGPEHAMALPSNYRLIKRIGGGAFGQVYRARNLMDGTLLAVKVLRIVNKRDERPDDERERRIRREVELVTLFNHTNIMCCYGTWRVSSEEGVEQHLFSELVPAGSLKSLVREESGAEGGLEDIVASRYTLDVVQGLVYLHSCGIVHRDIKCDNILVVIYGTHQICKIGDFGECGTIFALDDGKNSGRYAFRGTPHFMAREVICQHAFVDVTQSAKVDIWSLGCTVIEMLTGRSPLDRLDPEQVVYSVGTMTEPHTLPSNANHVARDFIKRCLQLKPNDRPHVSELLRHPWLASHLQS